MSSKTIYWAVLLDEKSRGILKATFKPRHAKVYAEHTTLVFNPHQIHEAKWSKRLGEKVELSVIGHAHDDKGDAVVVKGIEREDGGIAHITISCADGTKPVYSNVLLGRGFVEVPTLNLTGHIAKYTDSGWVK